MERCVNWGNICTWAQDKMQFFPCNQPVTEGCLCEFNRNILGKSKKNQEWNDFFTGGVISVAIVYGKQ